MKPLEGGDSRSGRFRKTPQRQVAMRGVSRRRAGLHGQDGAARRQMVQGSPDRRESPWQTNNKADK